MVKVEALRTSLADRSVAFDETTARELFLYLIAPVLPQVRGERLVILPHEDLHYVPFQVFQDPGDRRYLGERYQISYAPSASVFLQLPKAPAVSGGRLLAVADPRIPAAADEVAAVARVFPGQNRIFTTPLAREADVKAAVGGYDIVHLAVHGKFDAAEPLLSYLELGAGGGDDGRLTAAEMFGLPLAKSRVVGTVRLRDRTGRSYARKRTARHGACSHLRRRSCAAALAVAGRFRSDRALDAGLLRSRAYAAPARSRAHSHQGGQSTAAVSASPLLGGIYAGGTVSPE